MPYHIKEDVGNLRTCAYGDPSAASKKGGGKTRKGKVASGQGEEGKPLILLNQEEEEQRRFLCLEEDRLRGWHMEIAGGGEDSKASLIEPKLRLGLVFREEGARGGQVILCLIKRNKRGRLGKKKKSRSTSFLLRRVERSPTRLQGEKRPSREVKKKGRTNFYLGGSRCAVG